MQPPSSSQKPRASSPAGGLRLSNSRGGTRGPGTPNVGGSGGDAQLAADHEEMRSRYESLLR